MFVLDIISGIPPTGPNDGLNELFGTENKIVSLESLLRSIYLKESYDYDPNADGLQPYPGLDNSDIDVIRQALSEAREEESTLLDTVGDTLTRDPSVRYGEIKNEELMLDQQIAETQATVNSLNEASNSQDINGANSNENEIGFYTDELNRLTSYREELQGSDKFWSELTSSHEEFEISMQRKDEFFNGISTNGQTDGGYNRILGLEGLLGYLESGKNGNGYDVDPDTDGIQTIQGITNLNNKNEIREQIARLQVELLNEIPAVKNETWFKTFLNGTEGTIGKIDEEAQALEAKTNSLNQAFISMVSGELSEVTIGDVKYSSVDAVRNQILRTNSYLQDLNAEKDFLNQINNIASADDPDSLIDDASENLFLNQSQFLKVKNATFAMYRTMELQGLLTNLTIGKSPSYSIPGVSNNIILITAALAKAEKNETTLMEEAGITPESTALLHLEFTKKMNAMVSNKISDLQKAEQFLVKTSQMVHMRIQSTGYLAPNSLLAEDPNLQVVRFLLKKIQTYKNQVNESEAYWNKVVDDSRQAALNNTSDDTSNNSSGTIQTIIARTGKNIKTLKGVFDFMSSRDTVENLESQEAIIKDEIAYQIRKLNSLSRSSPTFQADKQRILSEISNLEGSLSQIVQEKSRSTFMDQITASVKDTLSRESTYKKFYTSYS